jgi:Family of unknown function (DUF6188)
MELNENRDGWILSFEDRRVQLIQIDFRLNFLVTDGPDRVWLHIETPGRLKIGTMDTTFIPEQSVTLAPMLALFNSKFSNVRIAKTGQLVVEFEQDRSMFVAPDKAYEAWQIECSTEGSELMLVCPPSGDVALFRDSNIPRRAGNLHLN